MLKQFFEKFELFSDAEIEEISKMFSVRKMRKNDVFLAEGKKCDEVAFVVSGVFRSFYLGLDGEETTYCFCFPGSLVASYASFVTGNESVETLQAISDVEILVVKKEDLENYGKDSLSWMYFQKLISDDQYIQLERRFFQFQKDTAIDRYQNLLQTQPKYLQEIPLKYLASYLGISQRHLSRIRKEKVLF